jgi:hypothetical protein
MLENRKENMERRVNVTVACTFLFSSSGVPCT